MNKPILCLVSLLIVAIVLFVLIFIPAPTRKRKESATDKTEPTWIRPIICECGLILPTLEGYEEHKRLGHFDPPTFVLSDDMKRKVIWVIRRTGCFNIHVGSTPGEVYFIDTAGSTPTLFVGKDEEEAVAFVKSAREFAHKANKRMSDATEKAVLDAIEKEISNGNDS